MPFTIHVFSVLKTALDIDIFLGEQYSATGPVRLGNGTKAVPFGGTEDKVGWWNTRLIWRRPSWEVEVEVEVTGFWFPR